MGPVVVLASYFLRVSSRLAHGLPPFMSVILHSEYDTHRSRATTGTATAQRKVKRPEKKKKWST